MSVFWTEEDSRFERLTKTIADKSEDAVLNEDLIQHLGERSSDENDLLGDWCEFSTTLEESQKRAVNDALETYINEVLS